MWITLSFYNAGLRLRNNRLYKNVMGTWQTSEGIRPAVCNDWAGIWDIFHRVVKQGTTYVYDPDTTEQQARDIWLNPTPLAKTFVMEKDGQIVATYLLKPNQPGLGDHVANAGFMVHPDRHGQGIGRRIAEHCLVQAKEMGFLAMQFNFVISTNIGAVGLWQSLGFEIAGILPKVYRHATEGLVDAYVMHRFL